MERKNYFWYSIYLNFISLLICVLCIIFSTFIHKFLIVSIVLTIMVIAEMVMNIANYNLNKRIDK